MPPTTALVLEGASKKRMGTRIRKNIAERKLSELLGHTENEQLFVHVWAVDAIQSGREVHGLKFVRVPREAITQDMSSAYAVHKWQLETLINESLSRPRATTRPI